MLEKGVVMVHEGPTEQSPRVYDVIEAQKVDVVGVSGDWIQIRDEKGREGWLTSGEVGRL